MWGVFLLPMVVTACTALIAQIEYRGRAWDHLLALPIPRWRIFLAKTLVVLAATIGMTALMLAATWLGAVVGGAISGLPPGGALPWARLAHVVPLMLASGAGAGAQNVMGTAVFAGMLIATALGVFIIPGNYSFVESLGRRRGARAARPADEVGVPAPAHGGHHA